MLATGGRLPMGRCIGLDAVSNALLLRWSCAYGCLNGIRRERLRRFSADGSVALRVPWKPTGRHDAAEERSIAVPQPSLAFPL
jgi:hypothetical protein